MFYFFYIQISSLIFSSDPCFLVFHLLWFLSLFLIAQLSHFFFFIFLLLLACISLLLFPYLYLIYKTIYVFKFLLKVRFYRHIPYFFLFPTFKIKSLISFQSVLLVISTAHCLFSDLSLQPAGSSEFLGIKEEKKSIERRGPDN